MLVAACHWCCRFSKYLCQVVGFLQTRGVCCWEQEAISESSCQSGASSDAEELFETKLGVDPPLAGEL